MNIDKKLGSAVFVITVFPIFTREVNMDPILYEKMRNIFSHCELHIPIICTNSKYSNVLKHYAEDYSTINELLFFVKETKINHETCDLFLNTNNEGFEKSVKLLRNSPLRLLFNSEYDDKILFDDSKFYLRLNKKYEEMINDINKYLYAFQAKAIFFKELNGRKTFDYYFV